MADYGTIKIPQEDYERHNERRKEMGQTWAEYIDGKAPAFDGGTVDEDVIIDAITSDLLSQLPPKIADELR